MAQISSSSGHEDKGKSRISNRGFASMTPEQQRQIASKGGQAAHKKGVAHEWTSEEARAAGKKGGQASKKGAKPEDGIADAGTGTASNRESDTSRANVSQQTNEEPDSVQRDERNPQRQDLQQNRGANR